MIKKIDTTEQFDEIIKQDEEFFLLKHSLTCPISKAAFEEYEKFADENQNVPAYYLAVQDSRPLSNEVAEKFQIKHESPQAILFENGKPHWNASHWKITKQSLESALSKNKLER